MPNKGTLSETAVDMLREAGYAVRRDPKELIVSDPRNDVEFFYLRPRDIATYVGSGALDVGVTGRDLLLDSHSAAVEIEAFDFGASTFRFAGPVGSFAKLADLAGTRVATSYSALVGDFLGAEGGAATGGRGGRTGSVTWLTQPFTTHFSKRLWLSRCCSSRSRSARTSSSI